MGEAVSAVAHGILRMVRHLLDHDCEYVDLGPRFLEERDRLQIERRLVFLQTVHPRLLTQQAGRDGGHSRRHATGAPCWTVALRAQASGDTIRPWA